MGSSRLQEQLEAEAKLRGEQLASRFGSTRCVACGVPRAGLVLGEFRWTKSVGRNAHHQVTVRHESTHTLCPACLEELKRRRRWFWPIRYAGGIALAAALCGIVAAPALLYCLKLDPEEHRQVVTVGIAAVALLPAAIYALRMARRFSVPEPLFDMTGGGWECTSVRKVENASAV